MLLCVMSCVIIDSCVTNKVEKDSINQSITLKWCGDQNIRSKFKAILSKLSRRLYFIELFSCAVVSSTRKYNNYYSAKQVQKRSMASAFLRITTSHTSLVS